MQGDRENQAKDLDAMQGIAETLADDARRAYTVHRRATRAMRMARYSECAQFATRAAALAEAALASSTAPTKPDDDLYELRLMSLRLVGLAMTDLGRWDAAQALLQKTLNEARARGLLKPQVTCLNSLAVLADRRGDEQRALQLHRESLEMLRRIGGQRNEAAALVNVGGKLVGLGDLAGGRRDLEEGFRLARQNGDRVMECAASCNLSQLALWQGDDAHALATARSALDTAVAMQARDLEVAASLYLGRAEETLGRLVPAAQAFAHSHRVALEIGAGLSFEANVGLASVAAAHGDIGGALDALRPLLSPAGPVGESDAIDGVTRAFESAAADAAVVVWKGSFPTDEVSAWGVVQRQPIVGDQGQLCVVEGRSSQRASADRYGSHGRRWSSPPSAVKVGQFLSMATVSFLAPDLAAAPPFATNRPPTAARVRSAR